MNRPVRRVALYGYLGSGNLGNDASFETILAWLKYDHPDRRTAVHHHRTGRDSRQVRRPVSAVGLAYVGSGPQPSAEASRKLLGRAIDVPRSYALAGLGGRHHRPGHGRTGGAARRTALGFALRALSHGGCVPATSSALPASRCRRGMGDESCHQAAVCCHGSSGDARQL